MTDIDKIYFKKQVLYRLLLHSNGVLALPDRKGLWKEATNMKLYVKEGNVGVLLSSEMQGDSIDFEDWSDDIINEIQKLITDNLTWSVVRYNCDDIRTNSFFRVRRYYSLTGVDFVAALDYLLSLEYWERDGDNVYYSVPVDKNFDGDCDQHDSHEFPFMIEPYETIMYSTEFNGAWKPTYKYQLCPSLTGKKDIRIDSLFMDMMLMWLIKQQPEGKLWLFQAFEGHYITCEKDDDLAEHYRNYTIRMYDCDGNLVTDYVDETDRCQIWLSIYNFPIYQVKSSKLPERPLHTTTSFVDALDFADYFVANVQRNLADVKFERINPYHLVAKHEGEIIRETLVERAEYNEESAKLFNRTYRDGKSN